MRSFIAWKMIGKRGARKKIDIYNCWATPISFRTPCWRKGDLYSGRRLSRPIESERERSVIARAFARRKSG